jgi:hypothetical protein
MQSTQANHITTFENIAVPMTYNSEPHMWKRLYYVFFTLGSSYTLPKILYASYACQRSRYSDWLLAGRPKGPSSSPCEVKNIHISMLSRLSLGSTQPPIQWVPGALSLGVKRQGREADLSPPSSAKVKKTWVYTFTLPYASMARCLT